MTETESGLVIAGAHDTPGTYALTPAPPGPNPGQPGHFAHHNWLEASVKSLAVPAPQSIYSATGVSIPAGSVWTYGGAQAVIVNPSTTQTLLVMCGFTGQATIGAGVVLQQSVQTTGATVLDSGFRGEIAYNSTSTSTVTWYQQRLITINPGTTNVRLGALCSAGGPQNISYWKLVVTPLQYV